jgi:hypothetical protein
MCFVYTFSSVKGKKVLRDIMLSGVMERSAFSLEPLTMAANTARQDFARHIYQMAQPVDDLTDKPKKAKRIKHEA